jgi:hypothetical protein
MVSLQVHLMPTQQAEVESEKVSLMRRQLVQCPQLQVTKLQFQQQPIF